jgi:uncharacterized surface protein with fasciclin (FAS1) repeats
MTDVTTTTRRSLGFAGLSGFALAATLPAGRAAQAQPGSLLDLINTARDLSHFAGLIRAAGLEEEFRRPGNFGVFIPHNAAVEKLSGFRLRELENNREVMRQTILYHVTTFTKQILAGGSSESSGMVDTIRSVAGGTLHLTYGMGALPRINGAPIFVANMRASNGIAHCVDEVLRP